MNGRSRPELPLVICRKRLSRLFAENSGPFLEKKHQKRSVFEILDSRRFDSQQIKCNPECQWGLLTPFAEVSVPARRSLRTGGKECFYDVTYIRSSEDRSRTGEIHGDALSCRACSGSKLTGTVSQHAIRLIYYRGDVNETSSFNSS